MLFSSSLHCVQLWQCGTKDLSIVIAVWHNKYCNYHLEWCVRRHLHIMTQPLNTLRPRQNGRHFADDIFKCIFLNENVWIPIKFSLKFVPQGSINKIPALVQIMAWHRPGDKPLSGPMMVGLPTHIYVTRPQWVKALKFDHIVQYFADNIS